MSLATTIRVPYSRISEIIDGCEGVQGGPYQVDRHGLYVWAPSEKGGEFPLADHPPIVAMRIRGWGYYTGHGSGALGLAPDNAATIQRRSLEHFARLDPATVKSALTELLAMRDLLAERQCRQCGGRGIVANPGASYTEDYCDGRRTGMYSTNDPEEIDCPLCDGVGFVAPESKSPPAPLHHVGRDDGMPF